MLPGEAKRWNNKASKLVKVTSREGFVVFFLIKDIKEDMIKWKKRKWEFEKKRYEVVI